MNLFAFTESDSVAIALRSLNAGEIVNVTGAGFRVNVMQNIPMGHKISLHEIHAGDKIIKYGFPIGEATSCCGMR